MRHNRLLSVAGRGIYCRRNNSWGRPNRSRRVGKSCCPVRGCWQAGNETGDTHLNGRVTGNGSGIDRSGVSAFVCEQETVAVAADGRIDSQTVQAALSCGTVLTFFVHEIGRIVGVGVLYVLLAGREA